MAETTVRSQDPDQLEAAAGRRYWPLATALVAAGLLLDSCGSVGEKKLIGDIGVPSAVHVAVAQPEAFDLGLAF